MLENHVKEGQVGGKFWHLPCVLAATLPPTLLHAPGTAGVSSAGVSSLVVDLELC